MSETHFEVTPGKAWTGAERDRALDAIHKAAHPDFAGYASERWGEELQGQRTILTYRNGTCLVLLSQLTDQEISDKLPRALIRPQ